MSDFAAIPATAAPPPEPVARPAPQSSPMTPEQAREAIKRFEERADWRAAASDPNAPGRLALMDQRRALYDAAYPEPAPDASSAPSPAATRGELDVHLWNHVNFPASASDDDRAAFRNTARAGLAALGATVADAGWFTKAASEVLKAPDSFTPERAERELRAAFGERAGEVIAAAKAAVERLPQDVRAQFAETPLGNNATVIRLLAQRAIAAGWTQGARQ